MMPTLSVIGTLHFFKAERFIEEAHRNAPSAVVLFVMIFRGPANALLVFLSGNAEGSTAGLSPDTFAAVQGLEILLRYKGQFGKTAKEFNTFTETNQDFLKEIKELAQRVEEFSMKFDMPGNEEF